VKWSIYRPGDGRGTRWAAWGVIVTLGLFACYRFYYWGPTFPVREWVLSVGQAGTPFLFVLTLLGATFVCFVHPRFSVFLIEVDDEVKRTTWPDIKPWFKKTTEVWGHTYVVLFVMLAMGLFLAAIDYLFQWLAQTIWYQL
jgi:preprotein translocase SecE subunit